MDQLPFRAKPKVVDLTSTRKLADKVGGQCRVPACGFFNKLSDPDAPGCLERSNGQPSAVLCTMQGQCQTA